MPWLRLLKSKNFIYTVLLVAALYYFVTKDIYDITAYSNHKISINKEEFRDYRFASNKKTYFGGVAASKRIPFGTKIELIAITKADEQALDKYFEGRRVFIVEDRGFLVKGKVIDIFVPRRLGGHQTAKKWGRRKLKVKITFPEDQKINKKGPPKGGP